MMELIYFELVHELFQSIIKTYQYNYTINGGICGWVGLGGHALGGGYGFLPRLHGSLIDNILELFVFFR